MIEGETGICLPSSVEKKSMENEIRDLWTFQDNVIPDRVFVSLNSENPANIRHICFKKESTTNSNDRHIVTTHPGDNTRDCLKHIIYYIVFKDIQFLGRIDFNY